MRAALFTTQNRMASRDGQFCPMPKTRGRRIAGREGAVLTQKLTCWLTLELSLVLLIMAKNGDKGDCRI